MDVSQRQLDMLCWVLRRTIEAIADADNNSTSEARAAVARELRKLEVALGGDPTRFVDGLSAEAPPSECRHCGSAALESIYWDVDYAGCARLRGALTRRCLSCSSKQLAVQAERDVRWRIALHAALTTRSPQADQFLREYCDEGCGDCTLQAIAKLRDEARSWDRRYEAALDEALVNVAAGRRPPSLPLEFEFSDGKWHLVPENGGAS